MFAFTNKLYMNIICMQGRLKLLKVVVGLWWKLERWCLLEGPDPVGPSFKTSSISKQNQFISMEVSVNPCKSFTAISTLVNTNLSWRCSLRQQIAGEPKTQTVSHHPLFTWPWSECELLHKRGVACRLRLESHEQTVLTSERLEAERASFLTGSLAGN